MGFDIKELMADEDEPVVTEATPAAAPAPATPAAPVEAKKAEEKPPVAGKTDPPPVAATPVTPQQPEPAKPNIAEIRKQTMEKLEASFNKFSDEEIEQLRTEPEKIRPKVASNMMMPTYEAVTAAVLQPTPG